MDYVNSGRGTITTDEQTLIGIDLDLERSHCPGYQFIGFLRPTRFGVRVLALRKYDQAHVVFYAVERCTRSWGFRHRGRDAKRFVEQVSKLRRLQAPHMLPIADMQTNMAGAHWLIAPFVGSSAGISTFEEALAMRDQGRLEPQECLLAAKHLLTAIKAGRSVNIPHGAVSIDDVIVDKHGSLIIELFGVRRALLGPEASDEVSGSEAWGEVRSVARLIYRSYTGVNVPDEWIDPDRLIKRKERRKSDKQICAWLRHVLQREQPHGLDEALEALENDPEEPATSGQDSIAARATRSVLRAAFGAVAAPSNEAKS